MHRECPRVFLSVQEWFLNLNSMSGSVSECTGLYFRLPKVDKKKTDFSTFSMVDDVFRLFGSLMGVAQNSLF